MLARFHGQLGSVFILVGCALFFGALALVASTVREDEESRAVFQGLLLFCIANAVLAAGTACQWTTIWHELGRQEWIVERFRWIGENRISRFGLWNAERVEVAVGIPPELEPFVAMLPWKGIYAARTLVLVRANGARFTLTEPSKRSQRFYERLASRLTDALK